MNRFPHFKAKVSHRGRESEVHFMALYSQRTDAVPIVMLHGWPGE